MVLVQTQQKVEFVIQSQDNVLVWKMLRDKNVLNVPQGITTWQVEMDV